VEILEKLHRSTFYPDVSSTRIHGDFILNWYRINILYRKIVVYSAELAGFVIHVQV